jgi:hypothetical protein
VGERLECERRGKAVEINIETSKKGESARIQDGSAGIFTEIGTSGYVAGGWVSLTYWDCCYGNLPDKLNVFETSNNVRYFLLH